MGEESVLDRLRAEAPRIRERFAVRRLSVFGSVSRGGARPGSDVDILVEFEHPATFDGFMDLKFHLEELLRAHVDLVTAKALRPALRTRIEREAVDVA